MKPLPFKADENGKFRADGVPMGLASVEIPYNITADIIGTHSRMALVQERSETVVRFFDPIGAWDLPCAFIIGDGSKAQWSSGTGMGANRKVDNVTTREPMFLIELLPLGSNSVSFASADWKQLDESNRITVPDVHPGRYRLRVGDWFGSKGMAMGSLYEEEIEAPATGKLVRVSLGAGAITGHIQRNGDTCHMIHVMAIGEPADAKMYHATCDDKGNFCLRYLKPDTYHLVAQDCQAGWCVLGKVSVKDNLTELGTRSLVPGAMIFGKLTINDTETLPTAVIAKDSAGIAVEACNFHPENGGRYEISGLWPDKWRVTLMRGEETLVEAQTVIASTNAVNLDLK
jgi:hypothetical protein